MWRINEVIWLFLIPFDQTTSEALKYVFLTIFEALGQKQKMSQIWNQTSITKLVQICDTLLIFHKLNKICVQGPI